MFLVSTKENPVKKRKPPLTRTPLGNISNYQGHLPSQIKRAVTKVKANAVIKTTVCTTQAQETPAEVPVTVYEDINNEVIEVAAENENSTFCYFTKTNKKIGVCKKIRPVA